MTSNGIILSIKFAYEIKESITQTNTLSLAVFLLILSILLQPQGQGAHWTFRHFGGLGSVWGQLQHSGSQIAHSTVLQSADGGGGRCGQRQQVAKLFESLILTIDRIITKIAAKFTKIFILTWVFNLNWIKIFSFFVPFYILFDSQFNVLRHDILKTDFKFRCGGIERSVLRRNLFWYFKHLMTYCDTILLHMQIYFIFAIVGRNFWDSQGVENSSHDNWQIFVSIRFFISSFSINKSKTTRP